MKSNSRAVSGVGVIVPGAPLNYESKFNASVDNSSIVELGDMTIGGMSQNYSRVSLD